MTAIVHEITSLIITIVDTAGYPGIFFLMALEGSFIPVPSEIILPFSGYLASEGRFSIWAIAFVGALGNIVGTLFTYMVARYLGLPFLYKYGKYVLVTRRDIEHAHRLFQNYGVPIIFLTRLVPGIRGFLPIPAGIARMNIPLFAAYVFIGSFLWSLLLTYIGVVVGKNWEVFSGYVHEVGTAAVILMIAVAFWWFRRQYMQLRKENSKQNTNL